VARWGIWGRIQRHYKHYAFRTIKEYKGKTQHKILKTIMVLPGSTAVTAKNWPNRYMEYALHGKYKIKHYAFRTIKEHKGKT